MKAARKSLMLPFAILFALAAAGMASAAGPAILSNTKQYEPFPGVEVREVTELSASGWLKYVVIVVDTASADIYVGPFTGGSFLDQPVTVLETLRSKGLIAAVNGDFFDTGSGMPLSMAVSEGSLLRSPRKDADFATLCLIAGSSGYIEKFQWSSRMVLPDGRYLDISSYNELSVGSSDATMYNALRSERKYPADACVALIAGNSVLRVFRTDHAGRPSDQMAMTTPFEYEIVATGNKSPILEGLSAGDKVRFEFNLLPSYPMEAAFSGKPVLVKDGTKVPGLSGFPSISGSLKAPRTMAGIGWDGKLYLVAVEGRSADSKGVTLTEAAELMIEIGCRDALNLDGGGSTQAAVSAGSYPVSLIGAAEQARKVSYSVGVAARDKSPVLTTLYPDLTAEPVSGPPFSIPPDELPRRIEEASSGIIFELPVVTVGTTLSMPAGSGIELKLSVREGTFEQLSPSSIKVLSEGYFVAIVETGGIIREYAMLAAGPVVSVLLDAIEISEDGLGMQVRAFDSHGRQVPIPASGLSFRLVIDGETTQLPGPIVPADVLPVAYDSAAVVIGNNSQDLLTVPINGSKRKEQENGLLLSGFKDASLWIAYGSPVEALSGIEQASGHQGYGIAVNYDFSGTGVRASYLKPATSIPLPEGTEALSIMVDGSKAKGHWLRANVRDGSNNRYFLDFGRLSVDGWSEYTAVLPEGGPFSLEQLYLVEFKDELQSAGTFIIDELKALPGGDTISSVPYKKVQESTTGLYGPIRQGDLSMEASIVSLYGPYAVPGIARIEDLVANGGFAYANGIAQWQKLIEACTEPGKEGILIIRVNGLGEVKGEGTKPLNGLKDANERQLLLSAAERAAYMGYSQVFVIERSSSEPLYAKIGGVTYLALP